MSHLPSDRISELPFAEGPAPSPELSERIREACTRDLKPSGGLRARARAVATVAVFLGTFALLYALSSASARLHQPAVRSALYGVMGWGAVMAGVLLVGLVRPPGRRWSRSLRIALAALMPALFFGWLWLVSEHVPLAEGGGHRTLHCWRGAMLLGAGTTLGVLWIWRGTDPLSPRTSGALAGLIGGVASAVAMGVACPTTDLWHVTFAHGMVVVAFVLGGAALGRRFISP